MAMIRWILPGLCVAGLLRAQSFPPEFRTDDKAAESTVERVVRRMSEDDSSIAYVFPQLISLPANRVYRQMDAQARVAALGASLPLLKGLLMSDALRKQHDEWIALAYGAVDHGLKLPPRQDARKRFEQMSEQVEKDPMVMQKPAFMQEFMRVQQEAANAGAEESFASSLTLFTKPLEDVRSDFPRLRALANYQPEGLKCFDTAAPLASSNPDRFRLLTFRCMMLTYGIEKPEAEADRFRKELSQRLYDMRSVRGLVRSALREFLQTAGTVDFSARTESRSGVQVFVNPAHEKKSNFWKLIYRNGKEPTEAAVQFAKAWLAELEPPAPVAAPAGKPAAAPKAAPRK